MALLKKMLKKWLTNGRSLPMTHGSQNEALSGCILGGGMMWGAGELCKQYPVLDKRSIRNNSRV
jgi:pantothenate kinase